MLETCLDHPRAQNYLFKHLDGKSKTLTHDQCFWDFEIDQEFLESCDFLDTISHP